MNFINILSDKYKINLNEQQRQAVGHVAGPALVLAGPGSGKTTVIVCRTAFLIMKMGVKPQNILTLTYNRAAKHEMDGRFRKTFGAAIPDKVHFSTLHSFCNMVVRDYESRQGKRLKRIEGEEENIENKRSILRNIYSQINERKINDDELEDLISEIGLAKNMMLRKFDELTFKTGNFSMIYKAYEEYKKSNLLMDFDDMLTFAYGILVKCPDILSRYQHKYSYIQVDEGQDLSKVQFEILKLLVRPDKKNLFIVADDDQSIYGFRGAEPRYILDMEQQFPGCCIYKLENNYRSSRNLVEVTGAFIKTNRERYAKDLKTENDAKGDPAIINVNNERQQLKFIVDTVKAHFHKEKPEKLAVLYRNNLSSITIVNALEQNGIPFNIKQNRLFFFKHWVVLDILAFLKFSLDQSDKASFRQIYYKMNRFISKTMMESAIDKEIEDSVLDSILVSNDLKPFQQRGIIETKNEFSRLAKLDSLMALEYIENRFKYFENVKVYCENTGQSYDYIYGFFGILKVIAADFQSIVLYLQRLEELSSMLDGSRTAEQSPLITLTTIHSSKGLEYESVLMVDLTEEEFPGKYIVEAAKKGEAAALEEERRLFYVGMTRARENLYLICPISRNGSNAARSPFIKEVEQCINNKMKNELCEGLIVNHKHFGEGVIVSILEQKNGRVILDIDFKGMRKKLDLSACLEGELLCI